MTERLSVVVGASLAILLTAACGTRVESDGTRPGAQAPRQTADFPEGDSLEPSLDVNGSQGAGATAATGAGRSSEPVVPRAPSASGTATPTRSAAAARPEPETSGRSPSEARDSISNPPGNRGPGPSVVPGPVVGGGVAPPDEAAGRKEPVVIASVGTFSGPIGAVFVPGVKAVQAWVAHVNARGGVHGHRVRHLVYDDGGDPARHKAEVQEAVERHNTIAFVFNVDGVAGRGSVDYITSKRIPVIGGDTGEQWWDEHPMYFPQTSFGTSMTGGILYGAASILVPRGRTKLATFWCAETPDCENSSRIWVTDAAQAGFELVYKAKVSVAQPDYTADCLAARNAGAEVVFFALDGASIGRFALSCARQGFHPTMGTFSSIAQDRMKDDPNLDGMIVTTPVFPDFQSGTPATDEFQTVMRNEGRDILVGASRAVGWVAAKLFERATVGLPDRPTSEAILKGLWSIKNDDLGGLTQPLTFVADQPAKPMMCWWTVIAKDKAWASIDRFTRHCR